MAREEEIEFGTSLGTLRKQNDMKIVFSKVSYILLVIILQK